MWGLPRPWRCRHSLLFCLNLCFRRATLAAGDADVRGGFVTTRSRLPARRLHISFPRVLMSVRLFLLLAIPIGMRPLHLIKGTRQPHLAACVYTEEQQRTENPIAIILATNIEFYCSDERSKSLFVKNSDYKILERSLRNCLLSDARNNREHAVKIWIAYHYQ